MENTVSQDALLVVLNVTRGLELGGVGVGLVQTHYNLSSLYHIQGLFVDGLCEDSAKYENV